MKKVKYKFGNGLAFLENKDVKMLEKMAAQGYLFEKITKLGFYKFRRTQAEECTYSIDYSDVEAKDEGFQQYAEIFKGGGWEYVTSLKNIHYFKAPRGTKSIYTDSISMAEKYEKMQRMCTSWVISAGVLTVICFALYIGVFDSLVHMDLWGVGLVLLGLAGAGIGFSAVMFQGILLNKNRATKLREGMVLKEEIGALEYEDLSKSNGKSFIWSAIISTIMIGIFALRVSDVIPQGGNVGTVLGSLVGAIGALSIAHAISMAFGFFSNRRKATKLRRDSQEIL